MEHKPFFFIANIFKPIIDIPFQLKPGYEIKKASLSQIKIIKTRLEKTQQLSQAIPISINSYECEFTPSEKDKSYHIDHLKNEEDWKYWILEIDYKVDEYEKYSEIIRDEINVIDKALLLSELNIHLLWGFLHYHVEKDEIYVDAISSYDYRPLNYFKSFGIVNTESTILDKQGLNGINELINRIQHITDNDEYIQIQKVIKDLVGYFEIPPKSPYRIIGLFAMLEFLLTTNDSGKSINKQLQTKLNLLNNRFSTKLNISEFFKISDGFRFEKIIEKLYSYRSDIAHGNPIDFENRLQVLNNNDMVEKFLLTLVRKIIRQSLLEPDLIIDLKKC